MSNLTDRLVYLTVGKHRFNESKKYPHCTVPCPNLHSSLPPDISPLFFFNEYPFRASHSLPVGPPTEVNREVFNGRDPSFELCLQKRRWLTDKKMALNCCTVKDLPDSTENKFNVSQSMARLLKIVKNDPDEYFDSSYNSYYTGGNISSDVELDGVKYFCSPTVSKARSLDLRPLIFENMVPIAETFNRKRVRLKQAGKCPFFQIIAHQDVIQTRQRNTCILFKIQNREEIEANIMHVAKHEKAFYGCCYDPLKNASFYLSADWMVTSRDLEAEKDVRISNLPCEESFWGSVQCRDGNVLVLTSRTGVYLLDLRERSRVDASQVWEIKDVTDDCEEVCALASGQTDLYVTTNHHLFALDLRQGWTQRWTHGISDGPGLVSVSKFSCGRESILIGSLVVDDVVHVLNDSSDSTVGRLSRVHPCSLPSLCDSLHSAHNFGLCLSPTVHSRFRMSMTGLCSYAEGDSFHILRKTSAGDVFHQKLSKRSKGEDITIGLSHVDVNHLDVWEKACENLFLTRMPKVTLCEQAPVELVEKVVKRVREGHSEEIPPKEAGGKDRHDVKGSWKHSKEKLCSYKDFLASRILQVWEIDEDQWSSSEGEEDMEMDESDDEDGRLELIVNWLERQSLDVAAGEKVIHEIRDFTVRVGPALAGNSWDASTSAESHPGTSDGSPQRVIEDPSWTLTVDAAQSVKKKNVPGF